MSEHLTKEDFKEHTTARRLNLSTIERDSPMHRLVKNLNCATRYGMNPRNSMMTYGTFCECDDSHLCEHRLGWLVNFIQENFEERNIKRLSANDIMRHIDFFTDIRNEFGRTINPIPDNIQVTVFYSQSTERADRVDNGHGGKEVFPEYPVSKFRKEIMDAHNHVYATMQRDPENDFGFEACFIYHKGTVYALIYTEQKALTDLWESLPEVEPFPYWDHSDPPKKMTYKQWEARGRLWDKILDNGPPNRVGISLDVRYGHCLFFPGYYRDFEMWAQYIPSEDERRKSIAHLELLNQVIKQEKIKPGEHGKAFMLVRELPEERWEEEKKKVKLREITEELLWPQRFKKEPDTNGK